MGARGRSTRAEVRERLREVAGEGLAAAAVLAVSWDRHWSGQGGPTDTPGRTRSKSPREDPINEFLNLDKLEADRAGEFELLDDD